MILEGKSRCKYQILTSSTRVLVFALTFLDGVRTSQRSGEVSDCDLGPIEQWPLSLLTSQDAARPQQQVSAPNFMPLADFDDVNLEQIHLEKWKRLKHTGQKVEGA